MSFYVQLMEVSVIGANGPAVQRDAAKATVNEQDLAPHLHPVMTANLALDQLANDLHVTLETVQVSK